MSAELNLVREVEKHECLYNYKLPEYSHRDATEKAWAEVATKTKLSVKDCKERWRNIRSSFLRSLKPLPGGCKARKPYYLKQYLEFVLPYIKPGSNSENFESTVAGESGVIAAAALIDSEDEVVTDEESRQRDAHFTQFAVKEPSLGAGISAAKMMSETRAVSMRSLQLATTRTHRRRSRIAEVEKKIIDYLQYRTSKRATEETVDFNSMRYFLLSLLPEFETMTEDQIRRFKIKVMMLIDEMKTNRTGLQQSSIAPSSSDTSQPTTSSTSSPG